MVSVGPSQNKLQCVYSNEGKCQSVQHCGSLMELYDTQEEDISGFDMHTIVDSLLVWVFSWALLTRRKNIIFPDQYFRGWEQSNSA